MKQICITIFLLTGLVASSQILVPFLKKNGKYIFVEKGSLAPVSKREYDAAKAMANGFAEVKLNDKWGFVDSLGNEISIRYDAVRPFISGSAMVRSDTQWGLVDTNGDELVKPQFEEIVKAGNNSNHIWISGSAKLNIVSQNSKYWFVNNTWAIKNSTQYDLVNYFREGLSSVKINDKVGFVDENETMVIPPQFDNAWLFKEGFAEVQLNKLWSFIDKSGKLLIAFQYENVSDFNEGFAAVRLNKKWGYIDKKGKLGIPNQYNDAERFKDGLAVVSMNGKWGCINSSGKEVIPIKCDYRFKFEEGFALVSIDGKPGYVDINGNITNLSYLEVGKFNEGLVRVRDENNKWGFINQKWEVVIAPQFDNVEDFKNGIAPFETKSGWGYINKIGKEILPPKFSFKQLTNFENGFAVVRWTKESEKGYFYVDSLGIQYRENKDYPEYFGN